MPGNISNPAAIAITSSTAANPIEIATSTVHGLTTGDWVDVYSHLTNLPANCVNTQVTVVDTTHFTIPISGIGYTAGGASGYVQPLSYTQNVATIPADGDPYAAATYTPGYTAALDRSAFERANSGAYKLVYYNVAKISETFSTTWFTNTTSAATVQTQIFGIGTPPPAVGVNDTVVITADLTLANSNSNNVVASIGCTWGNASIVTKIPGSSKFLISQGASSIWSFQLTAVFQADFGITAPQTVSPIGLISFLYNQTVSTAALFEGAGDVTLQVWVYRPTLILQ
jgi:hypothetical protein